MVRHGAALWARHEHVANNLSFGERAADRLKMCFGTWSLLFGIIAFILFWLAFVTDPGELRLNLGLSFVASVQGVVLQIAANRGDRISAEVALHTQTNTDQLMRQGAEIKEINERQLTMLTQHTQVLEELRLLRADLADGTAADGPVRGGAGSNPAEAGFPADGPMVPPLATEPRPEHGGAA